MTWSTAGRCQQKEPGLFAAFCISTPVVNLFSPRTIFPNILGHQTRLDAESGPEYLLLSVIHGLLNGECTPEIRLVGCSVLASPCRHNKMVKPCRSTCEALRKDCSHAFEAIEMAWPYFLDCDRFFASEQEGCYDPLAGLRGVYHLKPSAPGVEQQ